MADNKKDFNDYVVIETFALRSDRIISEQEIPLYEIEAFAGLSNTYLDRPIPLERILIPDMPECDGAVYVRGDSMEPILSGGDIALYKTTQSRRGGLMFGHMYVIDFNLDGEDYVVIKYLHESETPGHYRLESANPQYRPKEIPRDCVRTLAMVKGHIRYNTIK